jgi:hypothetical protein
LVTSNYVKNCDYQKKFIKMLLFNSFYLLSITENRTTKSLSKNNLYNFISEG